MPPKEGAEYERTKAQISLSCHHTITFGKPWPKEGEELWCRKCNEVRTVTLVPKRMARKVPGLPVGSPVRG